MMEEEIKKEEYEKEEAAEEAAEEESAEEAATETKHEDVTVVRPDIDIKKEREEEEKKKQIASEALKENHIFALRTTANREDQVMDFLSSNATKKKLDVYSVIRPHGLRGYIFLEAATRADAEQAAFNVPYARGILPNEIQYNEIEHMLEQAKAEYNIKKYDIVEIIAGAFKRENARVTRIDKAKEEVVVELLQAAVPIPITLKIDAVKVIRREGEGDEDEE